MKTNILRYEGDIPVIQVRLINNQMVFWCGECKRIHTHGNENGHRLAHCTSEKSRFKKTGYILELPKGRPTFLAWLKKQIRRDDAVNEAAPLEPSMLRSIAQQTL